MMYRSHLIREVETDLAQARARGYLKQPRFEGKTYTQVRAERERQWRKMKTYALGVAVLLAVLIAIGMRVL